MKATLGITFLLIATKGYVVAGESLVSLLLMQAILGVIVPRIY